MKPAHWLWLYVILSGFFSVNGLRANLRQVIQLSRNSITERLSSVSP
jgi:hypothetical protein